MVESVRELRLSCQRNETEFLPLRLLRKISIYFTWLLLHTPITANGATILSVMFGVLGSVFLAIGSYWYTIGGVLFLQLHLVLDCVDGDIARYRKSASWFGLYLDDIGHSIIFGLMFGSISWGVYRHHNPSPMVFALGLSAAIFSVLRYQNPMVELWARAKHAGSGSEAADAGIQRLLRRIDQKERLTNRFLVGIYLLLFDLVSIVFVALLVAAIFNRLDLILLFHGLAQPILFILTAGLTYRQWRRSLR